MSGGMVLVDVSGKAEVVMDANGQMLYYDSGRQALDKEDDDDVLTLKSGLPSWEASSGGATVEEDRVNITSNVTFTVDSFVDITGLVITIGNISGGKTIISCIIACERDSAGGIQFLLEDDGTAVTETAAWGETGSDAATQKKMIGMSYSMDADGSVIQVQAKTDGSTLTVRGSSSEQSSTISSISVG